MMFLFWKIVACVIFAAGMVFMIIGAIGFLRGRNPKNSFFSIVGVILGIFGIFITTVLNTMELSKNQGMMITNQQRMIDKLDEITKLLGK